MLSPRCLCLLVLCLACAGGASAQRAEPWWSAAVSAALQRAGDNRGELEQALRGVPEAHRADMAFLIEHMPPGDLRSLRADFLLENVELARAVMKQVPWGGSIPPELFLNDVLPYVNVSETREAWRRDFMARFLPLVRSCKTPGEAAQVLNSKIFGVLKVRYSTKRRRADQSPSESIATGMASCTGLSILLVDACRAVGVPARLAGIPRWVNKRGNHTWVEVWDGKWHFTGAAEYNKNGLDRAWFQRDAALARADVRENAIYAVSYRKTDTTFPMVWSRRADPVSAVNVTARYTAKAPVAAGKTRLMIRVRARAGGPRVVAEVTLAPRARPDQVQRGRSKGEQNDTNDFLGFDIDPKLAYVVRVRGQGRERVLQHRPDGAPEQLLDVALVSAAADRIEQAAAAWFAADAERRKAWQFDAELEQALRADEAAARAAVWSACRAATAGALQADFDAHRVRADGHESPYTVKSVGKRPAGGWPLFIAMHGGGGVPKKFNDSQWQHMQIYYRDQAAVEGYRYVALRAPNDRWNGFYDHYVWPLVSRLVQQFTVCGDVDPNRVFLMGYSHGGYGAFAIGANIPDRFAAVHASAAAPTPGITPAENLRNLRFTFMIGERDTRYGRRDRCAAFDAAIRKLRGERKDIYPVTMEFQKGKGHGGLPDRDKIKQMYPAVRGPTPRELTWRSTGSVVRDFYWLSNPAPAGGHQIDASCRDNRVVVRSTGPAQVWVGLDGRLVDFGKPIEVDCNGAVSEVRAQPRLAVLCESMARRGDPDLAYTYRLVLDTGK